MRPGPTRLSEVSSSGDGRIALGPISEGVDRDSPGTAHPLLPQPPTEEHGGHGIWGRINAAFNLQPGQLRTSSVTSSAVDRDPVPQGPSHLSFAVSSPGGSPGSAAPLIGSGDNASAEVSQHWSGWKKSFLPSEFPTWVPACVG